MRLSLCLLLRCRWKFSKIIAKVPQAEMEGYLSSLRSITQGRANSKAFFYEYAPVPYDVQRRLIEEYSKKEQEEFV
jgi:elongation factor G